VQRLDPAKFFALIKPGSEVFCAGCGGEPTVFLEWLKANPEIAAGVRFTGVWIPGVNGFDFSRLHPDARMRGIFLSADFADAWRRDRFELLTLPYSALYGWLKQQRFDLVLLQTGAIDPQQNFPLSIAADFSTAALVNAKAVAIHANPALPVTAGPFVPSERVDWLYRSRRPPLRFDAGPISDEMRQCARHIAAAIDDGATLQFGLGKMQSALAEALLGHRNLRVHSGMVSDPLLKLIDGAALAAPDRIKPPIVTGVALGSARLYRRLSEPTLCRFAQVGYTHAIGTLKQISRFTSVNSVLEVDLFGQANGELIDGAQVSGCGGMVDFVRGARVSAGGMSVLALAATTARGTRSRIVPKLEGPVSVARADVDAVATEYGFRRVRELDIDARAEALIELAAPPFRAQLTKSWAEQRARLRRPA
jgi:acyl-CoA hydrolase